MLNKERFMFGVFTFRQVWFLKALSFIFISYMDSWAFDKWVWRIQWILQNSSWKWLAGLYLCIWLCTCTWRAMQNCETSTPCDQYKLLCKLYLFWACQNPLPSMQTWLFAISFHSSSLKTQVWYVESSNL